MTRSALAAGLRHLRDKLAAQEHNDDSDEELLQTFLSRRDESAFAVLVRRHGPMVLNICRRVLGHEHDAEDAFQATFLVLARRAERLRKKTSLASFLHGIAYRVARKAKQSAARRRKHESQAPPRPNTEPSPKLLWDEVRALLDDEIARLPEKYRSVFVLFYLQDLGREETARRLGLKAGTVASRLDAARQRLQRRLARRGVELTAVLATTAVATAPASALPPLLISTAIQAALGEGSAGLVSAQVAALAKSAASAAVLSKTKIVAAVLLAATLLGSAVYFRATPQGAVDPPLHPAAKADDKPRTASPQPDTAKAATIQGRVLDPDSKPVRGAKLLFLWRFKGLPHKVWATSGDEGRFAFTVARSPAANCGLEMSKENTAVVAAAEGYGFAAARLDNRETATNLTLRLVKDDVPIRGRILNLEGKPIAGIRVRLNDLEPLNQAQLYVPTSGDLTDWLAALKANKKDPWRLEEDYLMELASPDFHLLLPSVTTGDDGRFELRGIGRERMVHLRIEGPTIATQIVNVMTRPGEKIQRPLSRSRPKGRAITYHGATFEILAAPTKPVVGVVRDRDTGKPLAGVTVTPNKITNPYGIMNFDSELIRTTTDKDGRYRLVGLPKGDDNQLLATTDDLPYLPQSKKVENTPGLEQVAVDFELKRGIWVKGRVTEKTTGKPLVGGVGYYCFRDNPHHKDIPSVLLGYGRSTREDGSYQFAVIPGRGLISVQVSYNDRYLCGVGAEKIKGPRRKFGDDLEGFDTYPSMCQTWNQSTVVEINPKPGDESIACDLVVVPARFLKGTVLGPDGKPLAGARQYRWDTLPSSEFTVWGVPENKLREPWKIEFVHEGKKLAGFVTVHGDEKGPLQVRLQPWGALAGLLVTPQGEPLPGVMVTCTDRVGDVFADKEGRFRIEGLTPGLKHAVNVSKEGRTLIILGGEPKDLVVKPGETLDLGVLRVNPAR